MKQINSLTIQGKVSSGLTNKKGYTSFLLQNAIKGSTQEIEVKAYNGARTPLRGISKGDEVLVFSGTLILSGDTPCVGIKEEEQIRVLGKETRPKLDLGIEHAEEKFKFI